jgi:hypothetical protein
VTIPVIAHATVTRTPRLSPPERRGNSPVVPWTWFVVVGRYHQTSLEKSSHVHWACLCVELQSRGHARIATVRAVEWWWPTCVSQAGPSVPSRPKTDFAVQCSCMPLRPRACASLSPRYSLALQTSIRALKDQPRATPRGCIRVCESIHNFRCPIPAPTEALYPAARPLVAKVEHQQPVSSNLLPPTWDEARLHPELQKLTML